MNHYLYSDRVYAAFGKAAHAAQLLERQLVTFLLLPEFGKTGDVTSATFLKVQKSLDKSPLGPLLDKVKSRFPNDDLLEGMCKLINTRRVHLIHHYFTDFSSLIEKRDDQIIRDIDQTFQLIDYTCCVVREINDDVLKQTGFSATNFYSLLLRCEQAAYQP